MLKRPSPWILWPASWLLFMRTPAAAPLSYPTRAIRTPPAARCSRLQRLLRQIPCCRAQLALARSQLSLSPGRTPTTTTWSWRLLLLRPAMRFRASPPPARALLRARTARPGPWRSPPTWRSSSWWTSWPFPSWPL